jgi:hypothetical protein
MTRPSLRHPAGKLPGNSLEHRLRDWTIPFNASKAPRDASKSLGQYSSLGVRGCGLRNTLTPLDIWGGLDNQLTYSNSHKSICEEGSSKTALLTRSLIVNQNGALFHKQFIFYLRWTARDYLEVRCPNRRQETAFGTIQLSSPYD